MKMLIRVIFLINFSLILNSCTNADIVEIKIGDNIIQAEIADTDSKREKGLMYRKKMEFDHGMLFVFDTEKQLHFWMKNTYLPLSIAYINKEKVIKEIHTMSPLTEKTTNSAYSVQYALEMNQGYFEKKGIKVGDRLEFNLP
ncbi:DUF192 domain-containing protein [Spirochaeta cellobiosiphila]|uniref:DUF192 domain-containing protein n=1 Tax=Spirochaeta cellobiosiphila TaxID=504483 RepID=UPI00048A9DDF|nr:DUF192 domain-containing protein [Spirochaeta cellobiosiphila]